jgi:hypothetical protein
MPVIATLLLLLCSLLAPLFAGCAGDDRPAPGPAAAPSVFPRRTIPAGVQGNALAELLREDLAARLGTNPGQVQVKALCQVTWPDGSIGVGEPGMAYTQALVPGFLAILSSGGKEYRYHGTAEGFIAADFVAGATLNRAVRCP